MNKGIKVLLILAACLAALGLLMMGFGIVNGRSDKFIAAFEKIDDVIDHGFSDTPIVNTVPVLPTPTPQPANTENSNLQPTPTTMPAASASDSGNAIDIKVSDLPAFNSIQVDVTTADICILPADGTEASLSIHYGDARHNPTYKVENGCLYVKDDPHKAKWDGKSFKEIMQDIAGSLFFIGGKGKIEIYLPAGTEYDKFEAETTTGDIICSAEITASELDVETTTGDIRVSGGIYDKIDAECTTGDISVAGGSYNRVTAECTTGDIHAEGVLSGSISFSCTTGDVTVASALPQYNYSIDASCTSGNITVDGHQCGKTYKGGKGEIRLDAETTTGDIHMSFSE